MSEVPDKNINEENSREDNPPTRHSLRMLRRIVKIFVAIIISILLIIGSILGGVAVMLKPEKLTPLLTEYASEYLNADIKAKRIELYFWSTFPQFRIEIDSLAVESRALNGLPKDVYDKLPADANSLMTLDNLQGSINIPSLLAGKISLHDIKITSPCVNIVCVNDSTANYMIFPESKDDSPTQIPDITFNCIDLSGNPVYRFFDLTTGTDLSGSIRSEITNNGESTVYMVNIDGNTEGQISAETILNKVKFGLDSEIKWSADVPYRIGLRNMRIGINDLSATINTELDFENNINVASFDLTASDVRLASIISIIPDNVRGELDKIDTDLAINLALKLTEPYIYRDEHLPSLLLNITTDGKLKYDRLNLNRVVSDITASIDGNNPDQSTIEIRTLRFTGNAVNAEIAGKITSPISNAMFAGTFRGGADLGRLPKRLSEKIGFKASGMLTADTHIRLRMSDLSASRYHHIKIDGTAVLKEFNGSTTRGTAVDIYTKRADLKFGSSSTIKTLNGIADSLLMASLVIDSATVDVSGNMHFIGKEIRFGAGMKNIASTHDTTIINPIGAKLSARLLKMESSIDSMTISLHKTTASGGVKRYNDNKHHAQMLIDFSSKLLRFTDPHNRVGLLETTFGLDFHPKAKPKYTLRMEARMDSLRELYPTLPEDSIRSMARKIGRRVRRRATEIDTTGHSTLDLSLDPSIFGWLNRLDAKVSLTARGGRVISSYFPVQGSVRRLGLHFNTDTVAIDTLRMRIGESVMKISGGIGNLRRALTRKKARINASFDISADTININEIAEAVFKGSAYANKQRISGGSNSIGLSDNTPDSIAEEAIKSVADSNAAIALIVPSNLNATLNLKADNVLYSDIWFQRLDGKIGVFDGAINLDRFAAFTPIGSIDLTALYSAPDMDNLRFAAGIVVRQLQLRKFLDMMPDIENLMPLLKDVEGVVTAEMAMTSDLDSLLDLQFHTLDAMLRLTGDSLVLIDNKTFESIGKWLMFKHKDRNMIDHMDVELQIKDNRLELYPFVFDFDRYKLGVSGSNDMDFNLDYHIAVLKSPIPFKFGVTIKGKPGHLKFRLGGAHFNENMAFERRTLTDTARVNLVKEIEKVFRFGVRSGKRNASLQYIARPNKAEFSVADTLTHSDSLFMIQNGVIERPEGFIMTVEEEHGLGHVEGGGADIEKEKDKKKEKKRRKKDKDKARRKEQ